MKTNAIKELSTEHRNIEAVVKSLHDAISALEQRQRLNVGKLRTLVEFLRVYADERHHGREEDLFFPILVQRGVPAQGCPIAGLNHEHEKARALVSALEEWVTFYDQRRPGADRGLRQTLQEITNLYKKHLWLEDAMVFPMAQKLLTEADEKELSAQFGELDRVIGQEVVQRLEQFAQSLSFQVGTASQQSGPGLRTPPPKLPDAQSCHKAFLHSEQL